MAELTEEKRRQRNVRQWEKWEFENKHRDKFWEENPPVYIKMKVPSLDDPTKMIEVNALAT